MTDLTIAVTELTAEEMKVLWLRSHLSMYPPISPNISTQGVTVRVLKGGRLINPACNT
jgi:hypothetical protein